MINKYNINLSKQISLILNQLATEMTGQFHGKERYAHGRITGSVHRKHRKHGTWLVQLGKVELPEYYRSSVFPRCPMSLWLQRPLILSSRAR